MRTPCGDGLSPWPQTSTVSRCRAHHPTVVVTVTGTPRGTDGHTAAPTPSWLEQLAVPYLVVGWLVNDIAVTVLAPTPPTV